MSKLGRKWFSEKNLGAVVGHIYEIKDLEGLNSLPNSTDLESPYYRGPISIVPDTNYSVRLASSGRREHPARHIS